MTGIYLSLGSNIGERAENIARAIAELACFVVRVVKRSALYETEPVEFLAQDWFLNCVVEVETELPPGDLMRALLEIERSMGRERVLPKGPRIIDMDILLYGSRVVREAEFGDSTSADGGAEICAGAFGGDCGSCGASSVEEDCRGVAGGNGGSQRGEIVFVAFRRGGSETRPYIPPALRSNFTVDELREFLVCAQNFQPVER